MPVLQISPALRLRPLLYADIVPMAALANNYEIARHLRDYFPYPYTTQNAEDFIQWTLESEGEKTLTFAIEEHGALAGVCGLILGSDIHRYTAEIGYWLGQPYWGRGLATQATVALTHYAFDVLELLRVYAYVFETNQASARVLEKAGFQFEGRMRAHAVKHDKVLDTLMYAATDSGQRH